MSPGKSAKSSLIRIKAEESGKVTSVAVKRKQEIAGATELASISNQVLVTTINNATLYTIVTHVGVCPLTIFGSLGL